jgi:cyclopropane-fatty-acyl-phospholipid synthase
MGAALTPLWARAAAAWLAARLQRRVRGRLTIDLGASHSLAIGAMRETAAAREGRTADMRIASPRALRRALLRGPTGLAQSYLDGDWDTNDLDALLGFCLDNREALSAAGLGLLRLPRLAPLLGISRGNGPAQARRNAMAHYDLGNRFFALWLDASMTYSCALFASAGDSLEAAQARKHARVLDLIAARPGDIVLDIGCGWGAFLHAAAQRGLRPEGITLSRQQAEHILAGLNAGDAGGQIGVALLDYRHTRGPYDRVVSIEMIEAVGERHWPDYFGTIGARLRPEGVAVIQAITIAEDRFPHYRRHSDFIARFVFPGGMLPTAARIERHGREAGLRLDHAESFPASYALTIRHWRERFRANWTEIARLGFDERFRRLWELYFAYCLAGFENGTLSVGLYRFVKPRRSAPARAR